MWIYAHKQEYQTTGETRLKHQINETQLGNNKMADTITVTNTGTQFFIPARLYQAAFMFCAKGGTRQSLKGVFLNQEPDGDLVLVATNMHILLKIVLPKEAFLGTKIQSGHHNAPGVGFILAIDITEKAFKMKGAGELWIYGDIETGIVQFVFVEDVGAVREGDIFHSVGVCEFTIIAGTFPAYTRVIPTPIPKEIGHDITFNPDFIRIFSKASSIVSGSKCSSMSFGLGAYRAAVLIKFGSAPEMTGVMMPMGNTK